jgi:diaminopimelate epimerase
MDVESGTEGLHLELGTTCGSRLALLDCAPRQEPESDVLLDLARRLCSGPDGLDALVVLVRGAAGRAYAMGAEGRAAELCGNPLLYAAETLAPAAEEGDELVIRGLERQHRVVRSRQGWTAVLAEPAAIPHEQAVLRGVLGEAGRELFAVDAGEPHAVLPARAVGIGDLESAPESEVREIGMRIEAASSLDGGVNVTLTAPTTEDHRMVVRTYERSVRRTTASCGAGAAAAAWVRRQCLLQQGARVRLVARGGRHLVEFRRRKLRVTARPDRGPRWRLDALDIDDDRVASLRRTAWELGTAPSV